MVKQVNPVVKFTRSDAPKPTKSASGTISIKSPFPLTLRPQSTAKIDFGLTCSQALIVTYCIGDIDKHVFEASKPIVLTLKNNSFSDDIVLDAGSTVINVFPLLVPEFDLA